MSETYGDVTGEYLALRRECGLVEGEHEVVWVRGPEAVTFLDGILSQHLATLSAGAVSRSLLLEPRGKLRAVLWVLRGEEEVGLVADRGRGEVVTADLNRFRIRVKAEVEPDPRPALELWGPNAPEVLAKAGLAVPDGWEGDGRLVARLPLGALPRFVVLGADREELVEAGARPAGSLAAAAVRVEAGEPKMGADVDEDTIPHESGLVPEAVSFGKGCFLGYELVERLESRGRARATLRGVEIRENVLPPAGAELVREGKTVGRLGTVGESLALRAPVALAVVRLDVEPGAQVEVRWEGGGTTGRVRELPLDDFGEAASS